MPYQNPIISNFIVGMVSKEVGKIGIGAKTVWEKNAELFAPVRLALIAFAATLVSLAPVYLHARSDPLEDEKMHRRLGHGKTQAHEVPRGDIQCSFRSAPQESCQLLE